MNIQWVYITTKDAAEAREIGRELVSSGLAACVNIIEKMNSIYMWEGELQEDEEAILIAKTTVMAVPALTEKVKALHSYECPCVLTLSVMNGNQEFLSWVGGEVKLSSSG